MQKTERKRTTFGGWQIRPRRRRVLGIYLGLASGGAVVVALAFPPGKSLVAHGTMNTGHETVDCVECHRPAEGTTRQQLQANTRYVLGLRASVVDFGMKNVENLDCLACHERPDDRHPVFRFNEPRFADAREQLGPHKCESCHLEHSGRRVTVAPDYCEFCHAEVEVEQDPLDTSHAELAAQERFDTCLRCHDFHGNHVGETPKRMAQMFQPQAVQSYFEGGESPYPGPVRHEARQTRDGGEQ